MAKNVTDFELERMSDSIRYELERILAAGFDVENLTETDAEKVYNKLSIAYSKIIDVRNMVL